jgi:hypothetical protein
MMFAAMRSVVQPLSQKNVPELVVSEPLMIAQLGALLLFQPATEVE